MTDIIIILILLAILAGAGGYVYRAKKRGQKCIGCPHAKACGSSAAGCGAVSQDCNGSCAGCSGTCEKGQTNM